RRRTAGRLRRGAADGVERAVRRGVDGAETLEPRDRGVTDSDDRAAGRSDVPTEGREDGTASGPPDDTTGARVVSALERGLTAIDAARLDTPRSLRAEEVGTVEAVSQGVASVRGLPRVAAGETVSL